VIVHQRHPDETDDATLGCKRCKPDDCQNDQRPEATASKPENCAKPASSHQRHTEPKHCSAQNGTGPGKPRFKVKRGAWIGRPNRYEQLCADKGSDGCKDPGPQTAAVAGIPMQFKRGQGTKMRGPANESKDAAGKNAEQRKHKCQVDVWHVRLQPLPGPFPRLLPP